MNLQAYFYKHNNIIHSTKIEYFYAGAHIPVTMNGNIVVDGILASCYAFSDHHLAHLTMTPMRFFPDVMDYIFGVVDNGSPGYVALLNIWV